MLEPDISRVTAHIWVGGALPEDPARARTVAQTIAALGVTHVVDCRSELDDQSAWSAIRSVHYANPGIDDGGQQIDDAWFSDQIEHLQRALVDPGAQVLVHCQAGVNRGPSLAFALLLAEGFSPAEAESLIRQARPGAGLRYRDQATAWFGRWSGEPGSGRADSPAGFSPG
ncbi:MAG: dual specificity protein phosphatase [Propionibacteriales bacterium]|nr:dual specificity protein phosphatase [Propionibacteriales bacterium]